VIVLEFELSPAHKKSPIHMLTLPALRIANGLENSTDLSLVAMHRLANDFVIAAILEYLDNTISPGLRMPHRAAV
jgi:hypothetical protein